jgi:sugar lactone lactonase YvrE
MKTQTRITRSAGLLALVVGFTLGGLYLSGIYPKTAKSIIYATAEHGTRFVKINVGTGEVTTIGRFGVFAALGLAFSPEGTAYTVAESRPNFPDARPRLGRIELATGKATTNGPIIPKFMALAFSPQGVLYGVGVNETRDQNGNNTGSLYTIDPTTGQATKVGVNGGVGVIMDLAFHPDGTLYGIDGTELFRVDLSTGKRTLVKTLLGLENSMGLVIDRDGTFYASDFVPFSPIVRIDITTGQTTPVVKTTINFIHGLDMLPSRKLQTARQSSH